MKHTLTALLLLGSCMTLPMLPASAQETSATAAKKQVKKPVKKASKKTKPADKHQREPAREPFARPGVDRHSGQEHAAGCKERPSARYECKIAEQLKPLQA